MLTENQKTAMRKLFEENDLTGEDVFTHKHFVIIKRSGIEKIQYKNDIHLFFDPVSCMKDYACIKATATKGEKEIQTFGSAHAGNCTNNYFAEMAEKRALARGVLKMMGLYEFGVFAEDEEMHKADGLD